MSSTVPSPPATNFHSPSLTIILAVVLLVFFILGFFSVYFCRCFMENLFNSWNLQRTPSGNLVGPSDTVNHGLDPLLIKSFPTFLYSSIKDFRREKYGLECAICLVEFEDQSSLRLLTVCYHVFHQECIDLWLESHTTCPVCRRNLDSPPPDATVETYNDSVLEHVISIDVDDDHHDDDGVGECRESEGDNRQPSSLPPPPQSQQPPPPAFDMTVVDKSQNQNKPEKFSRSHSTGHSIARNRQENEKEKEEEEEEEEEEDRYTLRVPEHVKLKLIRGHHWTKSCTTYGELCKHKANGGAGGFGEVSGCSCAAADKTKN
ncbi:RING-H2 finger protein ATL29 [Ziziphus jujuba]|uniref:RING-type E3 ubiquitin transferase n=2 Tax=Ziziphus jujuba TaxID=326968 RepID=A0ABM3I4F4_ZIZJJ|nr:RING-H2 finger protein ATL29 [Ziziphus jujuba]KAH7514431.1 hypothetical protein FEM48_Zijuj11G0088900 [Ziziphus jujuba var. spinosa]